MNKIKNTILFILYTAIIGSITGLIIWGFLKLNSLGIELLWNYLPNQINIPGYTIIVCLIGGIIIGMWKKKFGDYPEELTEVISEVKKTGKYKYNNLFSTIISSLAPLLIGASVGPEAGLTGIIAGLCTWVSDKIKYMFKEIKELTTIGITATLGTIFRSPLFGFIEPIESEEETKLPKSSKIILYFTAILSAFGIFIILKNNFGGLSGFDSISTTKLDNINWLYISLLTIIGIILGYIYFYSKIIITKLVKPLKNKILIKCIIGGLVLGIIGTLLPLTMFSGEEQISIILENGTTIGILILLLTGLVKIVLTNICIETGLKGGHFFPMIFSGISIGYAFSIILNYNPIICMAITTTSFLSHILKKPIATILLLMILFPPNLIPIMLVPAIIANAFKTPKNKELTK